MELTLIMADIVRISHFWQYTMKKNETLILDNEKFQNKNNYGLADVFSDAYECKLRFGAIIPPCVCC